MRRINKPSFCVADILDICISTVTPKETKDNIENSKAEIISAEIEYESKAQNDGLSKIPQMITTSHMSGNEMIKLYEYRMLQKAEVRVYYGKIMSLVRYGRCPFCNKQVVSTVDHYLPKSKYPIYAITPINLIAACRDCNTIKDEYTPENRAHELIHPYFDDIENDRWLFVKIQESNPIIFEYYIAPPKTWDNTTTKRVENHFNLFKLGVMYSSYASEYNEDIKQNLHNLYITIGSEGVKSYLQEQYNSCCANDKNSYKTALLECLMNNDWFCHGGFDEVYIIES